MAFKKCILAVVLLVVAMTASAAQPTVALFEVRPDGTRTLFTTERLHRNDYIVARGAEEKGAAACCVKLRILGTQRRRSDVSDELNGRRVRAYVLPSVKAADAVPFVGGALVFKAKEKPTSALALALNDSGGKMLPDVCTGSEGAHLLQLRDGKPQAHLYMHFSYAVEPTCSDEMLKRFY
jgi:hypothetical protein